MQVTGLTANEVESIVRNVATWYAGNLRAVNVRDHRRKDGKVVTFVLRANDSRYEPARRSHSGRRTVAVNWAAHFNVMNELFLAGATRISSRMADYRSYQDFLDNASKSKLFNVGSHIFPVEYGTL